MELAEPSGTNSDGAGGDSLTGNPSVSSSLEHLVAGSQGMITKRIDLALLEGRELLSRSIQGAALVGLGIVLAAAAWFALTASVVVLVSPDAGWVVRFAAFGSLNGAGAVGLVTLAKRHSRRPSRVRPNGNGSSTTT